MVRGLYYGRRRQGIPYIRIAKWVTGSFLFCFKDDVLAGWLKRRGVGRVDFVLDEWVDKWGGGRGWE